MYIFAYGFLYYKLDKIPTKFVSFGNTIDLILQ